MKWQQKRHPYEPPEWDEDVVLAMKSFVEGKANMGQQQTVWKWIQYVTGVGEFTDLSFRPGGADGERETTFAEGKRFVGLQLLKLLHPATWDAVERARQKPRGK